MMGNTFITGDHKEFNIDTVRDVTLHFTNNENKTSADDSPSDIYYDNLGPATSFNVRTDKTIQIVGMDDVTFTDPITIIIDSSYTETLNSSQGGISRIVIRTTASDTNIKVRKK